MSTRAYRARTPIRHAEGGDGWIVTWACGHEELNPRRPKYPAVRCAICDQCATRRIQAIMRQVRREQAEELAAAERRRAARKEKADA